MEALLLSGLLLDGILCLIVIEGIVIVVAHRYNRARPSPWTPDSESCLWSRIDAGHPPRPLTGRLVLARAMFELFAARPLNGSGIAVSPTTADTRLASDR